MKKNNLIFETIIIKKEQYLSEILNPLPSNAIIHKTLPGLGATFGEIYSKRNSIIIEPNVPVIIRKEEKHKDMMRNNPKLNKILGVYNGIYATDVVDYIKSNIRYKKIITTPEGFAKIKRAMEEAGINMYKDYFLLFDECERTIQDIKYRSNITAPINDFFKFESKAFVSATPLTLSDPRFSSQNFKIQHVSPDFNFKRDISLIHTNNVVAQVRAYIEKHVSEHYCFFLNSTETIYDIIKNLGIENSSLVHCASDSVDKLYEKYKFKSATENFTSNRLKKYNFFTSRFFSGLDMDLSFKPHVVILTDIYSAKHSIIDPKTESIQITGRFRNGVERVAHITNTKSDFPAMNESEALNYLKGCEKVFRDLIGLVASASNPGERNTLKQALERVEFANYIDNGLINHFMCDNFCEEERVKGYYSNINELVKAYNILPHFSVQLSTVIYPLGDLERLKRHNTQGKKDHYIEVANQLEKLYNDRQLYSIDNTEAVKHELRKICSFIVNAYEKIGLKGLKEANFNKALIRKAVRKTEIQAGRKSFTMLDLIYGKFKVGICYSEKVIGECLTDFFKELGENKKVPARHITYYFNASRRTISKTNEKGYTLISRNYRTHEEINSNKS